jgi:hypothetical protein
MGGRGAPGGFRDPLLAPSWRARERERAEEDWMIRLTRRAETVKVTFALPVH